MVIKLIFCVVVGLHLVVHGLLQDLSAQPYSKRNIAENDFQGDPHQRCLTLGGLPGYCQYTSSCPAVLTSTSSPTCGSTAHHLAKKVRATYSTVSITLHRSVEITETTQYPCLCIRYAVRSLWRTTQPYSSPTKSSTKSQIEEPTRLVVCLSITTSANS